MVLSVAAEAGAGSVGDVYSTTTYPYDCVCYIQVTYSSGLTIQGSGAIVGPHTILTASHLLWNADLQEEGRVTEISPAYAQGGPEIGGDIVNHYFKIDDTGGTLNEAGSQNDFAIIDTQKDLSQFGSFGIQPDYTGGTVHLTGYPGTGNGLQVDLTGDVAHQTLNTTLDYVSVDPSPGSSGGPLWIDEGTAADPQPYVVGVVSTDLWATQISSGDLQMIQGWVGDDSGLWTVQNAVGTDGADSLSGTIAPDSILAGAGDDTVSGSDGDDTINGGEGRSYLRGDDGDDSLQGGSGFDDINGNKGDDTIDGGVDGHDWLVGGKGDDLITGARADIIWGNLGNDTLQGGVTASQIRGGQGDDVIVGGSGNEFISGDRGNDTESGGAGADTFHGSQDAGLDRVLDFNQAEGDRVQLDPGTTYTLKQVGADTIIDMGGANQMVLVNVQLSTLKDGWIFEG